MDLDSLKGKLLPLFKEHKIEKAIHFGSLARNEASRHSDLDLILIQETNLRFFDSYDGLLAAFSQALPEWNLDLLIYTPEELAAILEVASYFQKAFEIDWVPDTTSPVADASPDRVRVSGVRGRPATPSYKVSMSYLDGYTAVSTLTYAWPDALEKAKAADAILRRRLEDLGLAFEEVRTEYLGYDSSHGPLSRAIEEMNEVVLRIGVRGKDLRAVERFGKEIAPLILTGPPSVTGFAGGRPRPTEVIAYWPALMPKTAVMPDVVVEGI